MSEAIRKEAKIVDKHDNVLVIEICTQEACSACSAKGFCTDGSELKTKKIELLDDGLDRKVGDKVTLLLSSSMGLKGAFFAYLLPVIVLLIAIAVMQNYISSQMTIGVIALALLFVYFFILWICRKKIEKQISITIE